MSTARENILAAAAAALAGTSGVSTRIFRSRVEALAQSEFPALIVQPISDSPDRVSIGRYEWTLTFEVIILVRADIADQNADPIVQDVHNKIIGDATLLSLVQDIVAANAAFDFVEANTTLGMVRYQFRALYQTAITI